ncbi:uncharacterized protein C12orf60 homolog [Sorex araneus]|uniref:uncharacterized protein C12orf60 homolog n=1 Tax=Sorex araneus TaxID=42254 RepID=UPI0003315A37|nr:uncharacterized protein C12orf60 homolog [Sorex araneus]
MSSESEKDKERLTQAAKTFFFQMQEISSLTKTFTEMFNKGMHAQINLGPEKEERFVKDVFEQILKVFKEMQSVLDHKTQSLSSSVSAAVDKVSSLKAIPQKAKEMLKTAPTIAPILNTGSSIFINLESTLALLMEYPIMNLKLVDVYRKEIQEPAGATTSKKSEGSESPQTVTKDTLQTLQETLKIETAENSTASTADQLEQITKNLGTILQLLQTAIQSMESLISMYSKAN